jgi:hypothetical protein
VARAEWAAGRAAGRNHGTLPIRGRMRGSTVRELAATGASGACARSGDRAHIVYGGRRVGAMDSAAPASHRDAALFPPPRMGPPLHRDRVHRLPSSFAFSPAASSSATKIATAHASVSASAASSASSAADVDDPIPPLTRPPSVSVCGGACPSPAAIPPCRGPTKTPVRWESLWVDAWKLEGEPIVLAGTLGHESEWSFAVWCDPSPCCDARHASMTIGDGMTSLPFEKMGMTSFHALDCRATGSGPLCCPLIEDGREIVARGRLLHEGSGYRFVVEGMCAR